MFCWQRTDVSNTCHLTCVLQLELSIHDHYRELTNSISSLQQLCCLHPYHPWHWLNLAMSFQRLLESDSGPERSSTEEEHEKQRGTNNILALKTIMCLIRTRYCMSTRRELAVYSLTWMLIDELIHCWVCSSCDFRQAANWNPADSAVLIRTGEQPEGSTRHWGSSTCSAANGENDSNNLWGQTTITTLIERKKKQCVYSI